jgi:hypothetical protein
MTPKKKKRNNKENETITTNQIDIILYELRDLRKEVSELKSFMNKSKGTLAVLLFLAGLIATIITALDYFKK